MGEAALGESHRDPVVSQGTLRTSDGAALPLEHTDVSATVTGPLAEVVVRQRFRNDRATAIEAVYSFPLPEEASVYRLVFRIADRIVEGVVKEKAAARRDYERALSEGRAATLLEEDKPTVFTLSVANIAPNSSIDVELTYQDLLAFDDGLWRLVFPMVAPERFLDPPAHGGPRPKDDTRAHDVTLAVQFPKETPVEGLRCESHLVSVEETDGAMRVALRADGPLANRDFVLTWRASEMGVRPWLYFNREPGHRGTFLLALTPSQGPSTTEQGGGKGDLKSLRCGNCGGTVTDLASIKEIPGLGPVVPCKYCGAILTPGTDVITQPSRPRDVLVLVDRSASMRGVYGDVQRATLAVLRGLSPGDAVEVCLFDHELVYFGGMAPRYTVLSPELVTEVERFLSGHPARGGSDLENALEVSGKLDARDGRTKVVVLVTDGKVGNEGRLFRRTPELLGKGTKLFVLGVGEGVERRRVGRLAKLGHGASEVLSAGMNTDDTLARFVRRVRAAGPVLTDLKLWWEGAGMTNLEPETLPNLHGGEALRVLGHFDGTTDTTLVITALTDQGKPFRQELAVKLPRESHQAPGLPRAWARRRVASLAEKVEREPVVAEEGLLLSLRYALVSRWTSLVAEDKVISVEQKRARRGRLTVRQDGRVLSLDQHRKTLGRVEGTDLQLNDGNISRIHAEIVWEGEAFFVRDLSSTNGVFVNGAKVREAALKEGDEVSLGNTAMVFSLADGQSKDGWFSYNPIERAKKPADMDALRAEAEKLTSMGASPMPQGLGETRTRDGVLGGAVAGAPPVMRAARARASAPEPFAESAHEESYASASISLDDDLDEREAPMRKKEAYEGGIGGGGRGGFGPPPPGGPGRPGAAMPMSPAPAASFGAPPSPPGMPGGAPPPPMMGSASPWMDAPPLGAPPPPPPMAPAPFAPRMVSPAPLGGAPPPKPEKGRAVAAPTPLGTPAYSPPVPSPLAPMASGLAPPQVQGYSAPNSPLLQQGSEPYPEHELRYLATHLKGELDLVFLVDATGSMGAYIAEVKTRLLELLGALQASPLCKSLRVGMVSYRDHPPQEHSYITRVTPLSDDHTALRMAVQDLQASGGGDGPEAVTDGLFEVVRCDWRPGAVKAAVWFGDAPPHGVEAHGDGFGNVDPAGRHWFTQAESCREMGVLLYAIGCLPGLRGFTGAEAVYRTVARATGGMFLPLREAGLLVPLMCGAAESALDGQRIDLHVSRLLGQHAGEMLGIDRDEKVRWLTEALGREGVRARTMEFAGESASLFPMRFRDVTEDDVRASLDRLRARS